MQRRSDLSFKKRFRSLRCASDGNTPLTSKELDMGHRSDEIKTYPPHWYYILKEGLRF